MSNTIKIQLPSGSTTTLEKLKARLLQRASNVITAPGKYTCTVVNVSQPMPVSEARQDLFKRIVNTNLITLDQLESMKVAYKQIAADPSNPEAGEWAQAFLNTNLSGNIILPNALNPERGAVVHAHIGEVKKADGSGTRLGITSFEEVPVSQTTSYKIDPSFFDDLEEETSDASQERAGILA